LELLKPLLSSHAVEHALPFTSGPVVAGSMADESLDRNPRYRTYRFDSKALPGERQVSVYVPGLYLSEPERCFPVFYLQDGQNLFDGRRSYLAGSTWQAHTTADRMVAEGSIEPVILVGVDHAGVDRIAEYTPTRDRIMGGGKGASYGRLLLEELKPEIDRLYRTLPGPQDTAVGGSSLGGLISLYLGFTHSEAFGKVAAISPSLWWDHRSIFSLLEERVPRPELRLWLDIGTGEGARHVRDVNLLDQNLRRRGWREGVDLKCVRAEGGTHEERSWAGRFSEVLRFLFPGKIA
jgi:predicted alpha/beta superfamily hydrolase